MNPLNPSSNTINPSSAGVFGSRLDVAVGSQQSVALLEQGLDQVTSSSPFNPSPSGAPLAWG